MWSDHASIVRLPPSPVERQGLAIGRLGVGHLAAEEMEAPERPQDVALAGRVADLPVDRERLLEHLARRPTPSRRSCPPMIHAASA